MVQVQVKKQKNNYLQVIVCGHSEFAKKPKDIVCSAISAIVFGTLNALDELTHNSMKLVTKDNEVRFIVLEVNDINQIVIKTMLYQLQTIAQEYYQNLRIEEK